MYQKPTVQKFGMFRDLTRAGCTGTSDGATFYGTTGPSVGDEPRLTNGTIDFCFTAAGSR